MRMDPPLRRPGVGASGVVPHHGRRATHTQPAARGAVGNHAVGRAGGGGAVGLRAVAIGAAPAAVGAPPSVRGAGGGFGMNNVDGAGVAAPGRPVGDRGDGGGVSSYLTASGAAGVPGADAAGSRNEDAHRTAAAAALEEERQAQAAAHRRRMAELDGMRRVLETRAAEVEMAARHVEAERAGLAAEYDAKVQQLDEAKEALERQVAKMERKEVQLQEAWMRFEDEKANAVAEAEAHLHALAQTLAAGSGISPSLLTSPHSLHANATTMPSAANGSGQGATSTPDPRDGGDGLLRDWKSAVHVGPASALSGGTHDPDMVAPTTPMQPSLPPGLTTAELSAAGDTDDLARGEAGLSALPKSILEARMRASTSMLARRNAAISSAVQAVALREAGVAQREAVAAAREAALEAMVDKIEALQHREALLQASVTTFTANLPPAHQEYVKTWQRCMAAPTPTSNTSMPPCPPLSSPSAAQAGMAWAKSLRSPLSPSVMSPRAHFQHTARMEASSITGGDSHRDEHAGLEGAAVAVGVDTAHHAPCTMGEGEVAAGAAVVDAGCSLGLLPSVAAASVRVRDVPDSKARAVPLSTLLTGPAMDALLSGATQLDVVDASTLVTIGTGVVSPTSASAAGSKDASSAATTSAGTDRATVMAALSMLAEVTTPTAAALQQRYMPEAEDGKGQPSTAAHGPGGEVPGSLPFHGRRPAAAVPPRLHVSGGVTSPRHGSRAGGGGAPSAMPFPPDAHAAAPTSTMAGVVGVGVPSSAAVAPTHCLPESSDAIMRRVRMAAVEAAQRDRNEELCRREADLVRRVASFLLLAQREGDKVQAAWQKAVAAAAAMAAAGKAEIASLRQSAIEEITKQRDELTALRAWLEEQTALAEVAQRDLEAQRTSLAEQVQSMTQLQAAHEAAEMALAERERSAAERHRVAEAAIAAQRDELALAQLQATAAAATLEAEQRAVRDEVDRLKAEGACIVAAEEESAQRLLEDARTRAAQLELDAASLRAKAAAEEAEAADALTRAEQVAAAAAMQAEEVATARAAVEAAAAVARSDTAAAAAARRTAEDDGAVVEREKGDIASVRAALLEKEAAATADRQAAAAALAEASDRAAAMLKAAEQEVAALQMEVAGQAHAVTQAQAAAREQQVQLAAAEAVVAERMEAMAKEADALSRSMAEVAAREEAVAAAMEGVERERALAASTVKVAQEEAAAAQAALAAERTGWVAERARLQAQVTAAATATESAALAAVAAQVEDMAAALAEAANKEAAASRAMDDLQHQLASVKEEVAPAKEMAAALQHQVATLTQLSNAEASARAKADAALQRAELEVARLTALNTLAEEHAVKAAEDSVAACAAMARDLAAAREEAAEAGVECDALRAQVATLQSELQAVRASVGKEMEVVAANLERMVEAKAALEAALTDAAAQVDALTGTNAALTVALDESRAKELQTQAALAAAVARVEAAEVQLSQLRAQAEAAGTQSGDLQTALSDALATVAQLRARVQGLERDVATGQAAAEAVEVEAKARHDAALQQARMEASAAADAAMAEREAEVVRWRVAAEEATASRSRLEGEHAATLAALHREVAALRDERDRLASEAEAANIDSAALAARMDTVGASHAELEAKVAAMHQELQAACTAAQEREATLVAQVAAAQSDAITATDAHAAIVAALQEQVAVLRAQASATTASHVAECEAAAAAHAEELAVARKERDDAVAQASALQVQVEATAARVAAEQAACAELSHALALAQATVTATQADLNRTQAALGEAEQAAREAQAALLAAEHASALAAGERETRLRMAAAADRAAAEEARSTAASLTAALEEARAEVLRLSTAVQDSVAAVEVAKAATTEAMAAAEAARVETEDARAAAAAQASLATGLTSKVAELEAEVTTAQAAATCAAGRCTELEAALAEAVTSAARAASASMDMNAALATSQAKVAALEAELAQLRAMAAAESSRRSALESEIEEARRLLASAEATPTSATGRMIRATTLRLATGSPPRHPGAPTHIHHGHPATTADTSNDSGLIPPPDAAPGNQGGAERRGSGVQAVAGGTGGTMPEWDIVTRHSRSGSLASTDSAGWDAIPRPTVRGMAKETWDEAVAETATRQESRKVLLEVMGATTERPPSTSRPASVEPLGTGRSRSSSTGSMGGGAVDADYRPQHRSASRVVPTPTSHAATATWVPAAAFVPPVVAAVLPPAAPPPHSPHTMATQAATGEADHNPFAWSPPSLDAGGSTSMVAPVDANPFATPATSPVTTTPSQPATVPMGSEDEQDPFGGGYSHEELGNPFTSPIAITTVTTVLAPPAIVTPGVKRSGGEGIDVPPLTSAVVHGGSDGGGGGRACDESPISPGSLSMLSPSQALGVEGGSQGEGVGVMDDAREGGATGLHDTTLSGHNLFSPLSAATDGRSPVCKDTPFVDTPAHATTISAMTPGTNDDLSPTHPAHAMEEGHVPAGGSLFTSPNAYTPDVVSRLGMQGNVAAAAAAVASLARGMPVRRGTQPGVDVEGGPLSPAPSAVEVPPALISGDAMPAVRRASQVLAVPPHDPTPGTTSIATNLVTTPSTVGSAPSPPPTTLDLDALRTPMFVGAARSDATTARSEDDNGCGATAFPFPPVHGGAGVTTSPPDTGAGVTDSSSPLMIQCSVCGREFPATVIGRHSQACFAAAKTVRGVSVGSLTSPRGPSFSPTRAPLAPAPVAGHVAAMLQPPPAAAEKRGLFARATTWMSGGSTARPRASSNGSPGTSGSAAADTSTPSEAPPTATATAAVVAATEAPHPTARRLLTGRTLTSASGRGWSVGGGGGEVEGEAPSASMGEAFNMAADVARMKAEVEASKRRKEAMMAERESPMTGDGGAV